MQLLQDLPVFSSRCQSRRHQKGIAATRVPGRMKLASENGAKVFIDYAHNGDSLKNWFLLLKLIKLERLLWFSVRLETRGESRRKDGLLLNQHPEIQVFLTADDPNYEDPMAIAEEISSYISHPVEKIADRGQLSSRRRWPSQIKNSMPWLLLVRSRLYQIAQGKSKTILETRLSKNSIYKNQGKHSLDFFIFFLKWIFKTFNGTFYSTLNFNNFLLSQLFSFSTVPLLLGFMPVILTKSFSLIAPVAWSNLFSSDIALSPCLIR